MRAAAAGQTIVSANYDVTSEGVYHSHDGDGERRLGPPTANNIAASMSG